MRKTYPMPFFALVLFSTSVNAIERSEEIPDSLRTLLSQKVVFWMNAYNSGDAKELIPFYSENAEYISSHVNGLVANGRNRIIENFQNGMNIGGHIDKIEILSINYSSDLVALLCRYEATNSGEKAIGRNLLVLKRMNKNWLIVIRMTVV